MRESSLSESIRQATERPHIARARWPSMRDMSPSQRAVRIRMIVRWAEQPPAERAQYRAIIALAVQVDTR